jgi:hypothetical protein
MPPFLWMPCRPRLPESFPRRTLCNKPAELLYLLESTYTSSIAISGLAHAQTIGGEDEPARSLSAIGGPWSFLDIMSCSTFDPPLFPSLVRNLACLDEDVTSDETTRNEETTRTPASSGQPHGIPVYEGAKQT